MDVRGTTREGVGPSSQEDVRDIRRTQGGHRGCGAMVSSAGPGLVHYPVS